MTVSATTQALKEEARRLGFAAVAVSAAVPLPETLAVFEERIERGSYEGLPWFSAERAARATEPVRLLEAARSVVTLAAPYKATLEAAPEALGTELRGRVARYAWGRDYHRVLEKKLKHLAAWLDGEAPGTRTRALVDYGPLAERAFAARGGLGWIGKSTNLLTREGGSWVLLGDLITTAELREDAPLRVSCGNCARCPAACPTGAIVSPYDVDNRLCISYHTIENRGPVPRALRPLIGDWLFGCDVCQDACPVPSRVEAMPEFRPATVEDAAPALLPLLSLSEDGFRERFAGRPLMRAKRAGLLRNACIVLGNLGDERAVPALTAALTDDPAALVRGHAAWALGELGARRALLRAYEREGDGWVREEIDDALAGGQCSGGPPPRQPLRDWLAGERWTPPAPLMFEPGLHATH